MPRIYPAGLDAASGEWASQAERKVFEALKGQLPDNWVMLHSLWLKSHQRKAHAEVDFVVLGDGACLLIEVKGGEVRRHAGEWQFISRSGNVATSREGPFDQVRGTYYAIKEHLAECGSIELFHNLTWGYGVILPDCVLEIRETDSLVDPEMLLDLREFPEGLKQFLDRLTDYWTDRVLRLKNHLGIPASTLNRKMPAQKRDRVLQFLRPDFEVMRGLGVEARRARDAMIRLTEEQLSVLDYAAANKRLLVFGAAGTGKTVLALEQARRKAQEGRVLLSCFNRYLVSELEAFASQHPEMASVDILNYHQLAYKILRDSGFAENTRSDWHDFNRVVEESLYDAIESGNYFEHYDYLVVDEAQDLMEPSFMEILALLIKGGLSEGEWMFCFDPNQTIFAEDEPAEIFRSLEKLAFRLDLSINCRNTRQIAAHVKGLTKMGAQPSEDANGPQVDIGYYSEYSEYLRKLRKTVNRIIQEFVDAGIEPCEIVILTTDRAYLPDELRQEEFFIRPTTSLDDMDSNNSIRMGTVQSFKGLEANAVIMVGVRGLGRRPVRKLTYVGTTRARHVLYMLLPETEREYVQTCNRDIIRYMRNGST